MIPLPPSVCRGFGRAILIALLGGWITLASAAAPAPAGAAEPMVTLNFVNADVEAVIRAVSEMTGRNFVIDPKVKGTINIVSAKPVSVALVYPTLLSALRLQGFAVIEGEGFVKVVTEADAKQQGGAVVTGGATGPGGDRLVTEVIPLRYESASQLVAVLRPLITPNNTIAAFPSTNALVITDYSSNLKRIERIIASLDQPPAGEPVIVPVRYASAIDLVTVLNKLALDAVAGAATADAQQRVTMVADPRSNSIIVRSDNSGRVARVRQMIEQLDTPGRPGGNIFIVYLKHAEAARVALTLRALLSGGSDVTMPTTPTLATASGSTGTTSGTNTQASNPQQNVASTAGGSTTSSAPGFTAGGAAIQADPTNNALIIQAPEPIYNNLRAIIDRLDIRRAQVYVEVLLVEVTADKAAQFGIQWQALTGIGKSGIQGFGGTNFGSRDSGNNVISASANLNSLGQGLNVGILNGTVTIPGLGEIVNLAFLARALETDGNANILSTPSMLTLDNEEAKIVIGQNVPFITGSYAQTGSSQSVTPFQTVERKDVGITLRVRPQITEGGSVKLGIFQEVSRIDPSQYSLTNPAGLITYKRAVESSVIVDDGQIVVLGGLISDEFADDTQMVPLLGNLPLIGWLFRYDNRGRKKTNLMVFLKPTVVRNGQSAEALTQGRYEYLIGEQKRATPVPRLFWNDTSQPELQVPSSSATPLVPSLPQPRTLIGPDFKPTPQPAEVPHSPAAAQTAPLAPAVPVIPVTPAPETAPAAPR